MTIKLFSFRITLFKVEKLKTANLEFDTEAAKKQAEEIKQSAQFAELKAKAAAMRATR